MEDPPDMNGTKSGDKGKRNNDKEQWKVQGHSSVHGRTEGSHEKEIELINSAESNVPGRLPTP